MFDSMRHTDSNVAQNRAKQYDQHKTLRNVQISQTARNLDRQGKSRSVTHEMFHYSSPGFF